MEKPVLTVAQALEALDSITCGLARLLGWLVFGVVHIALAAMALCALWWWQVPPGKVIALIAEPLQVAGSAGLSILSGAAAYLVGAQWVWRKTYMRWQSRQMLRLLWQTSDPQFHGQH